MGIRDRPMKILCGQEDETSAGVMRESSFNCSSAYLGQRIGACGSQQREERQYRFPCGEVRAVFEIGDRTIREGIHRVDQPGKSGWIFDSVQTGHVG